MGTVEIRRLALVIVAVVLACAGTAQAATTWQVNTTNDALPSGSECLGATNDCSIRQAIDKASASDTIDVPAGTYTLTIKSTDGGGALTISKSLTISGPAGSASAVVIKPGTGFDDRLVHITGSTTTAEIDNLSLNHAFQSQVTGDTDGSAAIKKDNGVLTLNNVVFDHDTTNLSSGALHNVSGDLNLTDVTFSNDQGHDGGGIRTDGGTVTATGVTFDGDVNSGGVGGAMYVTGGTVNLTNVTAVNGGSGSAIAGGIDNKGGDLTLNADTLNGNIRGSLETDSGTTTVRNSIIDACVPSGQTNGDSGTSTDPITTDIGDNVFGDSSCPENGDGDRTGALNLAPLADNGGKTETEALLVGSLALATPSGSSCPAKDQRGVDRTSCTPGAFQAVLLGDPTANTDAASGVGTTIATLNATINLQGEAGAYHFIWGTSPSSLNNSTPTVGAGVISSDQQVSADLTGLTQGLTYYFKVVADNASAETTSSDPPQQFTTGVVTPPPPTGSAILSGAVTKLVPFMPGFGRAAAPVAKDTLVTLTITTGKSQTHKSTRTGAGGRYTLTGLPACNKSLGQTCTVAVYDSKGTTREDQRTVQLRPGPSTTVVNLVSGQIPDRYEVAGAVLAPNASAGASADLGPGASAGPQTNLTISSNPGGKGPGSYDAANTCAKGGWSNTACKGGVGQYLLDMVHVAPSGGKTSSQPTITLFEKATNGTMVAVDSAKLKLPDDTPSNRAQPPTALAPDLHALEPVPSKSSGRSLTGRVTTLRPFLPGVTTRPQADVGAVVELRSNGNGGVIRHVKTDRNGVYTFTNVTECQRAHEECTVDVRGGRPDAIQDQQPVKLGELDPSVAVVDLQAGRAADRFMVSGSVIGPAANTDLTVSLLEKGKPGKPFYDAIKACDKGGWEGPASGPGKCRSATGKFLLGFVPLSPSGLDSGKSGASAHKAVLTLLERNPRGDMVPVDSARITLPADTKAHNENPPTILAPTLHTIDPAPPRSSGRSLMGQVTELQPNLPGTTPKNQAVPGAEVSVRIKTSKASTTKHTKTDKQGYYSVSDLPACGGGTDTCTVTVNGGKGSVVQDQRSFKLRNGDPSVTEVDLRFGRVADRLVISGVVLPPPFAGPGRPTPPATDLIISLGHGGGKPTVIYDAVKACQKGGWAGASSGPSKCRSTAGPYELGFVPLSKSGQPATATITLYEAGPSGKAGPVDSVSITLPADTKANNADPPTITAPDLQG